MKEKSVMRHMRTAGFSIAEMILIISVIAILVTLTYPTATEFFDLKRAQEERTQLKEISKALDAYARANLRLPLDENDGANRQDWADEIAPFTNLDRREILTDVWNNERRYYAFTVNRTYRAADLDMNYAYVYSTGLDRCLGERAVCANDDIDDALEILADDQDTFNVLEAREGDYMVKYSDAPYKKGLYETAVERLDRVAESLEEYGRSRYLEAVAIDEVSASMKIYFPPSDNVDLAAYGDYVISAGDAAVHDPGGVSVTIQGGRMGLMANGATVSNTPDDDLARRADMIALMEILGLPESHCCHPLEAIPSDAISETIEMPFYYYSSPRASDGAGGCIGGFPGVSDRKLPPRLTVEPYVCGR